MVFLWDLSAGFENRQCVVELPSVITRMGIRGLVYEAAIMLSMRRRGTDAVRAAHSAGFVITQPR
jgi:hypothetical protein